MLTTEGISGSKKRISEQIDEVFEQINAELPDVENHLRINPGQNRYVSKGRKAEEV